MILETIREIVRSFTDGDPHWDNLPAEWRIKATEAISEHILKEIQYEIDREMDDFDPAQWEEAKSWN
jgi:hypothetical protein